MAASENPPNPVLSVTIQKQLSQLGALVQSEHQAADLWQQLTAKEQADLGDDFLQAYTEHGTVGMWQQLRGGSKIRAVIEIAVGLGHLPEHRAQRLLRALGEASLEMTSNDAVLSNRQKWFLEALWKLQAYDSDTRQSTRNVVMQIEPLEKPANFKTPATRLRQLGLINSTGGATGGCWLTEAGKQRAQRLTDG